MTVGIDEAGRGPWAGPIVAAAVFLPKGVLLPKGVTDSKLLSEAQRESLADLLRPQIHFGIGECSAEEIDRIGLGPANRIIFERAYQNLLQKHPEITPALVLCDGTRKAGLQIRTSIQFVVKGELKHQEIACASILAKTHRDALLRHLDSEYPLYGFGSHKGYGTAAHQLALQTHGPIPKVHRFSFAPLKAFQDQPKEEQGLLL